MHTVIGVLFWLAEGQPQNRTISGHICANSHPNQVSLMRFLASRLIWQNCKTIASSDKKRRQFIGLCVCLWAVFFAHHSSTRVTIAMSLGGMMLGPFFQRTLTISVTIIDYLLGIMGLINVT